MPRLIDLSLPSPEENLALDAELFRAVEEEEGGEILRFWESSQPAVVLGHSCAVEKEVIASRCSEAGVPILRRSSGGGAVVLGPGCLVYTLILSLCGRPGLFNVEQSYRLILGRVSRSLGLDRDAMRGASDLAVDGRKISGNAQRRGRRALLHHGTILYSFDHQLMERFLHEPSRRPAWRGARRHTDFVANTNLSGEQVKERLAGAWIGY